MQQKTEPNVKQYLTSSSWEVRWIAVSTFVTWWRVWCRHTKLSIRILRCVVCPSWMEHSWGHLAALWWQCTGGYFNIICYYFIFFFTVYCKVCNLQQVLCKVFDVPLKCINLSETSTTILASCLNGWTVIKVSKVKNILKYIDLAFASLKHALMRVFGIPAFVMFNIV